MRPRRALRPTCLGPLLALAACAGAPAPAPVERFEFAAAHMGTEFRLVLVASDEASAARAARAAFGRVAELDARLSDYRDDSELSRLPARSEAEGWVALSPDLARVLAEAQAVARDTGGAFDVTVGPLVRLWRRARRQERAPTAARLAQARECTGFERLELDGAGRARLARAGMALDLGGIAKGYALDEALRVLESAGVRAALVDGGGDLRVGAAPPGEPGWHVALPDGTRWELAGGALCTSGDAYQFVELDGVRYSHIVDPRTGVALASGVTVSVVAPTGMRADAAASAASVLGPDAGLRWIESRPELDARFTWLEKGVARTCESSGWHRKMVAARVPAGLLPGATPGPGP